MPVSMQSKSKVTGFVAVFYNAFYNDLSDHIYWETWKSFLDNQFLKMAAKLDV